MLNNNFWLRSEHINYFVASLLAMVCAGLIYYLGTFVFGYWAALAIPEAYFEAAKERGLLRLSLWLLEIPSVLFSFGLVALFVGWFIGFYQCIRWKFCCLCCIGVYVVLALESGWEVTWLQMIQFSSFWVNTLMTSCCLLFAAYQSQRRLGYKSVS